MEQPNRDELLKEIPLRRPDFSTWPPGVRSIGIGEADAIGVDAKGALYWHGKPVEIRRPIYFTFWQKTGTFLLVLFAGLGGLGAAAQGWAVYHDWACKVGWWAMTCPNQ